MLSPNSQLESRATAKGWESIITEPKPAPVLTKPSARKPWNSAASIKPNKLIHSHAAQPLGWGLPIAAATPSTSTPAGTNRTPAINNGVVCPIVPFIATIAVPQRKKGAIKRMFAKGSFDSVSFNCMGWLRAGKFKRWASSDFNQLYSFVKRSHRTIQLSHNS